MFISINLAFLPLTIVLEIACWNAGPVLCQPLCVDLRAIIEFALLEEVSVQSGDVYDVSVDKKVT